MRVTGKSELDRFCRKYKECNYKESFKKWHDEVKKSNWDKPSDVIETFNKADPNCKTKSGNNVCIFNTVCGSRLICGIKYDEKIVVIKEALTHDEYKEDKWKER